MPKRSPSFGRRAWSLVRLTLLWARKGGFFKRRFTVELRLLPKLIKSIGHHRKDHVGYMMEHELSFDDTPVVRVKMHRVNSKLFHLAAFIPCINVPQIDFDCNFEGDGDEDAVGFDCDDRDNDGMEEGEEGIDRRAEEFIARFYEQMKLQRQISLLQHNQQ